MRWGKAWRGVSRRSQGRGTCSYPPICGHFDLSFCGVSVRLVPVALLSMI